MQVLVSEVEGMGLGRPIASSTEKSMEWIASRAQSAPWKPLEKGYTE
jgi:hypothetical protein